MATHLDLEEQEQLDQLKIYWKQYGNLITWVLIVVLGAYAAWNGWNWWQRQQAVKSSAMFDALDTAARAGDADAAGRIFADMKERYPRTAFTEQAGLLAAKVQVEKNKPDAAIETLDWVGAHATENEYRAAARLRAAGVLMDQKKYDDAMKQLDAIELKDGGKAFAALVADRRGDVLLAQGKKDAARAAYTVAWQSMDRTLAYRRLIEAKLTALGAAPVADAKAAGAAK